MTRRPLTGKGCEDVPRHAPRDNLSIPFPANNSRFCISALTKPRDHFSVQSSIRGAHLGECLDATSHLVATPGRFGIARPKEQFQHLHVPAPIRGSGSMRTRINEECEDRSTASKAQEHVDSDLSPLTDGLTP